MARESRQEYRRRQRKKHLSPESSKSDFSRSRSENQRKFTQKRESQKTASSDIANSARTDYRVHQLNFWTIFSDRPYVSVFLIVLAIFFVLIEFWWGLAILFVLVIIGIFIIGHSHHPNQVLSLEFKLKASRKLSMCKAIQLGTAMVMFLATYMRRVVSVNFSAAGSADSLHMIEGVLSNQGGSYGQRGAYFLNLLNTVTGGQLWGSYRYATNTAQMMDSAAGRAIIMWILLLMIAPAFCVVAQFFKDPYSRNATLVGSIISTVSLCMTPNLMKKWVVEYGMQNNLSQQAASQAITVGSMAYVAIICSFILLFISLYRFIKKDNFA